MSPPVQLWRIAEGVFVVTEAGEPTASTIPVPASELLQLIAACPEVWSRVATSNECRPMLDTPLPWTALVTGLTDGEVACSLGGATIALAGDAAREDTGWAELEGLREQGLARFVFLHPNRSDGSVVSIELRRSRTKWREYVKLLDLFRQALGRSMFVHAQPEQQWMWIAGPLQGEEDLDLTDDFALFEGKRQLPPVPVSHSEIRQRGDGRYLIKSGQVFFSSTRGQRPRSMWMVKRNSATERRLPFLSRTIAPVAYEQKPALADEIKAAIKAGVAHREPLRRGDNVVVLTHALPPGGAERQWCYLAGELKQMGFNVEFITLWKLEGENRHYLPLLADEAVKLTEVPQRQQSESEMLAGARAALERMTSGAPTIATENPFGSHLGDVVELFARLKPRVVFAQLDYCNLVAAAAGILAQVPQIVLAFRSYNPSHFPYFAQEWFQRWYRLLMEAPNVVLTGNSRPASADYAQWAGIEASRIHVVPNAVDVDALTARAPSVSTQLRRRLGLAADTPVILGVFRLSEEKRPMLFVETVATVLARVPRVRALIVGLGPLESAVRQRIEELKIGSSVQLLGRRDDVPELMAISSLLLLTSSLEGMPNVVLEAQAAGIPVVASNVGAVSDCIIDGQTGYVVGPDDREGFALRCTQLIENHELRRKLGASGTEFVRDSFSRRVMAERYLAVLEADCSESTMKAVGATAA